VSTFSFYLVDRDSPAASMLQFGEAGPDPDTLSAPLLRNPRTNTFYYMGHAVVDEDHTSFRHLKPKS
jgi:hypothetical protein